MLLSVSGALPVLDRMTGFAALVVATGWLAKAVGVPRLTMGAGTATLVPVPLRVTPWGPPAALSVTVSEPVLVPMAVGVKVALMVQLAAAARGETQLLV